MRGESLYAEHSEQVELLIRVVRRHLGIRGADAEDFALDVRTFVLERGQKILGQFQERSTFATYLSRVIFNYGYSWIGRRLTIASHESVLESEDALGRLAHLQAPGETESVVDGERLRVARRALCALPARDCAFLAALFGTDNHMDAVAAQFKMSRAAAYSKWYRLRDRLLQMIEASLKKASKECLASPRLASPRLASPRQSGGRIRRKQKKPPGT